VSTTETPTPRTTSGEGGPTPAKPPGLSIGALAVGIVMIAVFVGIVALIVLSFFDAIPEVTWPSFLVTSETTVEKFGLMFLAIGLFVAVMAALLFMVDSKKRVPNWTVAIAFVGPAIAALLFGLLWPMISNLIQSFYGGAPWYDQERAEFVGFDNYSTIFTTESFQIVLRNTILWVALVPLVSVALGLI
jgi:hypothetical protein